jgi:hypothetical protein
MSVINPVKGVNKSLFNIFTNSKLSITTIHDKAEFVKHKNRKNVICCLQNR